MGTMNVPKLPNDILINIIKMENQRWADEQKHKNKMKATFRYIERPLQMQNYCDELGYEEYGCYLCYRGVYGISEDDYYFKADSPWTHENYQDHDIYHDLLVNRICSCPNCPCASAYAETGYDDETCFDHLRLLINR